MKGKTMIQKKLIVSLTACVLFSCMPLSAGFGDWLKGLEERTTAFFGINDSPLNNAAGDDLLRNMQKEKTAILVGCCTLIGGGTYLMCKKSKTGFNKISGLFLAGLGLGGIFAADSMIRIGKLASLGWEHDFVRSMQQRHHR